MNSRKIRQQKEMRDLPDRLSLFTTDAVHLINADPAYLKDKGKLASRAQQLLREIHFDEEREKMARKRLHKPSTT